MVEEAPVSLSEDENGVLTKIYEFDTNVLNCLNIDKFTNNSEIYSYVRELSIFNNNCKKSKYLFKLFQ